MSARQSYLGDRDWERLVERIDAGPGNLHGSSRWLEVARSSVGSVAGLRSSCHVSGARYVVMSTLTPAGSNRLKPLPPILAGLPNSVSGRASRSSSPKVFNLRTLLAKGGPIQVHWNRPAGCTPLARPGLDTRTRAGLRHRISASWTYWKTAGCGRFAWAAFRPRASRRNGRI